MLAQLLDRVVRLAPAHAAQRLRLQVLRAVHREAQRVLDHDLQPLAAARALLLGLLLLHARRVRRLLLVRALALAASKAASVEEGEALLDECCACPLPKVGVQAAWLIGRACSPLAGRVSELIEEWAERIPAAEREIPLEILSISDAMK